MLKYIYVMVGEKFKGVWVVVFSCTRSCQIWGVTIILPKIPNNYSIHKVVVGPYTTCESTLFVFKIDIGHTQLIIRFAKCLAKFALIRQNEQLQHSIMLSSLIVESQTRKRSSNNLSWCSPFSLSARVALYLQRATVALYLHKK